LTRLLLATIVFLLAGCQLDQVVTADSEDIVIAEVYLRTNADVQVALLHRTFQASSSPTVPNALIEVTNAAGVALRYFPADDTMCVVPQRQRPIIGTCYTSSQRSRFVIPGESYALRITLPGGREITGNLTVPGNFIVHRPGSHECSLPPSTRFEIAWSPSPNAWVYPSEIGITGLRRILQPQGIDLPEPLSLFGLSVSSTDTTISFPNEFGLFDRFDNDLTEALVLIQGGLPDSTQADVTITAADRNYVNWERGGNFNPSGVVRIGNLRGDGAGVFGSLVITHFHIRVGSAHPPC
jgi:hypothetical protein